MRWKAPTACRPRCASTSPRGGRAAVLRDGRVQLLSTQADLPSLDIASLLARHGPATDAALGEALLAAVATAWAFGISPELIAAGLETFPLQAPA